jgi:XTP/dITP diphosphohydrolase
VTGSVGPLSDGDAVATGARFAELVRVMDTLRRECPWDRQQTPESLVRYLVEETYEVIEALESGDPDHLREELGDLLLQVVFHARIASERQAQPFGIDDVVQGIVEKLVFRHPHVFAGAEVADAADVQRNWEALKATEKQDRTSPLDGIPLGLPALSLAEKVVARRGYVDATHAAGTEGADNAEQITSTSVGDALFDLVVAASRAGVDCELALRRRVAREAAAPGGGAPRGLPDPASQPG